uniref:Uncharacterized protein n=1 Tax=Amphimedon queenslandica TaxID=400682 RepID=A0A1X7T4C8_AMPQE
MPYWVKHYKTRDGSRDSTPIQTIPINFTSCSLELLCMKQENAFPPSLSNLLPSPRPSLQQPPAATASPPNQAIDERTYMILLSCREQTSLNGGRAFKLYSSKTRSKAETALHTITCIIESLAPVLDLCLSTDLLSLLLLPSPRRIEELPSLVAQYAVSVKQNRQELLSLARLHINNQSILYLMCELTSMKILNDLQTNEIEFDVCHPVTGATLVHMATLLGDEKLSDTLRYLKSSMSSEDYYKYINRTCKYEYITTGGGGGGNGGGTNVTNGTDGLLSVDK